MAAGVLRGDPRRAAKAAEVIKALGHPLRLRLVAILCDDEHVTGLSELLGVQQSVVSQQLRILRIQGLVEVSRENGFAYYRLAEPRLRELIRCVEGCSLH